MLNIPPPPQSCPKSSETAFNSSSSLHPDAKLHADDITQCHFLALHLQNGTHAATLPTLLLRFVVQAHAPCCSIFASPIVPASKYSICLGPAHLDVYDGLDRLLVLGTLHEEGHALPHDDEQDRILDESRSIMRCGMMLYFMQ
jgi:hypothetical protein